jgi:hypothetical protein
VFAWKILVELGIRTFCTPFSTLLDFVGRRNGAGRVRSRIRLQQPLFYSNLAAFLNPTQTQANHRPFPVLDRLQGSMLARTRLFPGCK